MNETVKLFPFLLYDAASSWRNSLDNCLKPLGLSQAKWRTLLHLSIVDRPLSQTELAQRLAIENPTLVGLLDRLAKEDWIERHFDENDRRLKTIHLTKKAKAMLVKIHQIADKLRDELLEDISENHLKSCINVFKKIKSRAEEL